MQESDYSNRFVQRVVLLVFLLSMLWGILIWKIDSFVGLVFGL